MKVFGTLILAVTIGCSVTAQNRAADIVVVNGNVRTMNERHPRAEAVAITGQMISAVGTNAEVMRSAGPRTRVIDAEGRMVIPGFNDAHVHFMAIGNRFSSIDLRSTKDAASMMREVEFYARVLPKGRWILGSGWSVSKWIGPLAPNLPHVDKITPENPLLVYSSDPSIAFANSVALRIAGIGASTSQPAGGEIVRDAEGKPTGILKGRAVDLVAKVVPRDHTRRWAEIAETATSYAASLGVTSVQDMHSDDMTGIYRELDRQGKLKTRIYDCTSLPDLAGAKRPSETGDPNAMVRTGCLKGFHDGDDEWTPKLRADVIAADKAGWQVAIHAIGGKANRAVLGIFEEAVRINGPRDRRFRLEHAEGIASEDLERLGRLGVVASVQPYLFGGANGEKAAYYEGLSAGGAILAYGSDAPMTTFEPFAALGAVVRPTVRSGTNGAAIADLDLKRLKGYFSGSAFAEFSESYKGRIAQGHLADIVVLSENEFNGRGPLGSARVSYTLMGGKVVYSDRPAN